MADNSLAGWLFSAQRTVEYYKSRQ